jgi:hypothetical protein
MKRHHIPPENSARIAVGFIYPSDDEELDVAPDEMEATADLVRRVALYTLPPPSRHRPDRWLRTGYIRWVGLLYLTNHDLFDHRSVESVAKSLGISRQGFEKHLKALAKTTSQDKI